MCLLLIAIDAVPYRPFLLLGNRDEFHARATSAAQPWTEDARIVGGRDLVAGGSWLALRADGRFAAVTNLRSGLPATAPRSRGALVRDFVLGDEPSVDFLARVGRDRDEYGPFNLILGDIAQAWSLGSADGEARRLDRGVHVISNGPIGVRWPKTEHLRDRFRAVTFAPDGTAAEDARLLDLLADTWQPPDATLPDTGIGLDRERLLAPVFVRGEHYGTRASTLAYATDNGSALLHERRFVAEGRLEGGSAWSLGRLTGQWVPMTS